MPRTHNQSSKALDLCLTLVCLLTAAVPAVAESSNVVIRENVSVAKRDELVKTLRSITGWQSFRFDPDGVLRLGTNYDQGSEPARDLLNKAVSGDKLIILEDASARPDVVLQSSSQSFYRNGRLSAFVVLIDFQLKLVGDNEARAAST